MAGGNVGCGHATWVAAPRGRAYGAPMRTLQLLAALCVAACGTSSPEYDPATDTTRGMGDAGHNTRTDSPAACSPGFLWCYVTPDGLGFCIDPASRSSCGRCQNTCAPTRTCAAVAGVYACR